MHTRGAGASAVASAAYRAGEILLDARYDAERNYSRKEDVLAQGIACPAGAPTWARTRQTLWDEVERSETHPRAQLSREIIIGLPVELSVDGMKQVCRRMANQLAKQGVVVDWALHGPGKDNKDNYHAHFNLTTRPLFLDPTTEEWRWGTKHHLRAEKKTPPRLNKDGKARKQRPKRVFAEQDFLYHAWSKKGKKGWLEQNVKRGIIEVEINKELRLEHEKGRIKNLQLVDFDEARAAAAARGGPRKRLRLPEYRKMKQEQREAAAALAELAEAAAELEDADAACTVAERAYTEALAEREVEEGRKREEEALAACYATAKKTPSEENLDATYWQLVRMEAAVETDLGERLVRQVTRHDVREALDEIWPIWDKTRRNLAHLEEKQGFKRDPETGRLERIRTPDQPTIQESFQAAARIALAGGRAGSVEATLWLNEWERSQSDQGDTEAEIQQHEQDSGVGEDAQAIRRVELLYSIKDAGHLPPRFTSGRVLASGIRNDCKRHGLILPPSGTYTAKHGDTLLEIVEALEALEKLIRAITRDPPGMER